MRLNKSVIVKIGMGIAAITSAGTIALGVAACGNNNTYESSLSDSAAAAMFPKKYSEFVKEDKKINYNFKNLPLVPDLNFVKLGPPTEIAVGPIFKSIFIKSGLNNQFFNLWITGNGDKNKTSAIVTIKISMSTPQKANFPLTYKALQISKATTGFKVNVNYTVKL